MVNGNLIESANTSIYYGALIEDGFIYKKWETIIIQRQQAVPVKFTIRPINAKQI